ncbi:acyl carrier protein [Kitasatospora sp. NPDC006697]|uniref:acyl carrier protein n=1 Tax=Kitasatospora sp. NPDC006697 TaxID=3364020 RepID=UPI0036C8142B
MIDRIKDLLQEVLTAKGLPADNLTVESNLFVDFGLDSLALLEFLVELEARLGITVDFESLEYDDLVSLTSLERALLRA